MLKIVLVDDEPIVLRGISALIKREQNYELAGAAENGIEGLDLIRTSRPDIVMTDIRMPGMTGLEMIRRAKEEVPDCVYIVFSGFNEFKYAKEAIGLGVIDYVEKPVTVPKLREVLKKASEIFRYQQSYTEMTKDLQKADRVFIEKSLRDLYEHPSDEEILLQRITERNPAIRNAASVAVVKASERADSSVDDYRELVQAFTFDLIGDNPIEVYSFYEKENLVLVYFNLKRNGFSFRKHAEMAKRKLDEADGISVYIGISGTHEDCYGLTTAFTEADRALRYAGYLEADEVVSIDEVEFNDPLPGQLNKNHESLEFHFRIGNFEECRKQIREYLVYLKDLKIMPELFVRKCWELVHLLQLMLNESDTGKKEYLDIDYHELEQKISEEDYIRWTTEKTDLILNLAGQERNDGSGRAVREVKKFVEQHFAEGISLDDAAETVHMSKTYLSMLFKKEEGITYVKYLTKVRMEKAMEFLRKGYKAKEVCEMVGYHDYKYFSAQFKAATGMTLENYKKSL